MPEPDAAPLVFPRWVRLWSLGLAVVGLGLSIYLTVEHYTTDALLACPTNTVLNCGKVTASPESKLFGAPVAVLGLIYYVGVVALMIPWAWRQARLVLLRQAALAGGVAFVAWLVYAELFRIGSVCLYCTGVHITTVALFAVVLLADPSREAP
jgi:uncharacterized membrane protein